MSTLASWSFRSTPLSMPGVGIRRMTGPQGLPPLRGEDFLTPGVAGRLWVPKMPDSRRISLEIVVKDVAASWLYEYLDLLAALFSPRTQGALALTHPDGTTRTALAEVVSWSPGDVSGINAVYVGVVDFLLADPFFYGADVGSGAVSIASSPTAMQIVNAGTSRGPGPQGKLILDFYGPITNPKFTNSTTGAWVMVAAAVASTKHLLVDCVAITATNDGVNAIGSVTHSGALQLMELDPGTNVIAVTAVTPGGTLTVTHRDIYL